MMNKGYIFSAAIRRHNTGCGRPSRHSHGSATACIRRGGYPRLHGLALDDYRQRHYWALHVSPTVRNDTCPVEPCPVLDGRHPVRPVHCRDLVVVSDDEPSWSAECRPCVSLRDRAPTIICEGNDFWHQLGTHYRVHGPCLRPCPRPVNTGVKKWHRAVHVFTGRGHSPTTHKHGPWTRVVCKLCIEL